MLSPDTASHPPPPAGTEVAYVTSPTSSSTFMYNGSATEPLEAQRLCQLAGGHLASYSSVGVTCWLQISHTHVQAAMCEAPVEPAFDTRATN